MKDFATLSTSQKCMTISPVTHFHGIHLISIHTSSGSYIDHPFISRSLSITFFTVLRGVFCKTIMSLECSRRPSLRDFALSSKRSDFPIKFCIFCSTTSPVIIRDIEQPSNCFHFEGISFLFHCLLQVFMLPIRT